jgi:hypothetical protein
MNHKRQRPAREAGRLDTASRFVLRGPQNTTNTFRASLHRLPVSMRRRYLTDCRAADTAYRYLAEARRLLQGLQP